MALNYEQRMEHGFKIRVESYIKNRQVVETYQGGENQLNTKFVAL